MSHNLATQVEARTSCRRACNRIRWDKPAREADEIGTLRRMLECVGPKRRAGPALRSRLLLVGCPDCVSLGFELLDHAIFGEELAQGQDRD